MPFGDSSLLQFNLTNIDRQKKKKNPPDWWIDIHVIKIKPDFKLLNGNPVFCFGLLICFFHFDASKSVANIDRQKKKKKNPLTDESTFTNKNIKHDFKLLNGNPVLCFGPLICFFHFGASKSVVNSKFTTFIFIISCTNCY